MPLSSACDSTERTLMTSRVSSNGLAPCQPPSPSRVTHTVTCVPGSPRSPSWVCFASRQSFRLILRKLHHDYGPQCHIPEEHSPEYFAFLLDPGALDNEHPSSFHRCAGCEWHGHHSGRLAGERHGWLGDHAHGDRDLGRSAADRRAGEVLQCQCELLR